jgi:hypothetical protein
MRPSTLAVASAGTIITGLLGKTLIMQRFCSDKHESILTAASLLRSLCRVL